MSELAGPIRERVRLRAWPPRTAREQAKQSANQGIPLPGTRAAAPVTSRP